MITGVKTTGKDCAPGATEKLLDARNGIRRNGLDPLSDELPSRPEPKGRGRPAALRRRGAPTGNGRKRGQGRRPLHDRRGHARFAHHWPAVRQGRHQNAPGNDQEEAAGWYISENLCETKAVDFFLTDDTGAQIRVNAADARWPEFWSGACYGYKLDKAATRGTSQYQRRRSRARTGRTLKTRGRSSRSRPCSRPSNATAGRARGPKQEAHEQLAGRGGDPGGVVEALGVVRNEAPVSRLDAHGPRSGPDVNLSSPRRPPSGTAARCPREPRPAGGLRAGGRPGRRDDGRGPSAVDAGTAAAFRQSYFPQLLRLQLRRLEAPVAVDAHGPVELVLQCLREQPRDLEVAALAPRDLILGSM